MAERVRGGQSNRVTFALVAVVLLLALLYSVLILGDIAAFLSLVFTAVVFWLLYRFVRAHERIADAQERRANVIERRDGASDSTYADGSTD